jgi:hypothetical protein
MYLTIAVFAAAAIGLTLRLVWAKIVMNGEIYRIPLFWVVLMFIITLATSPKSTAFLLGVFAIDIIGSIAKDKEEDKVRWANILNWMMDRIPVKEKSNEETSDSKS